MTPSEENLVQRNGWGEWSKYVLLELERVNKCYEGLDKKVDDLKDKINMIHVRMAGIGAAVSLITTIVVLLLTNYIGKK